ncbi:MAG: NAD(P)-dependent oxidoreductase [Spirochaetota bacterium]
MSHRDNFQSMVKGFALVQALSEADRCLLCHDAPCSKGCPAGTDPGTFIRKLRLRNITGAIRTVKQNNFLGGACGALCPTAKLCEKECSATPLDRPIQIGKIQRFLIEYSWDTGFKVFDKPEQKKEKVAVIGSGPAGLSCAAELAKSGYRVTIFEERKEPGGIIRYGVPAYRFDKNFLKNELADLDTLGVEVKCSVPVRGREGAEKLLKAGFSAVFLAPGLWQSVRLKSSSGKVKGVLNAIEYLSAFREEQFDELEGFTKGKNVAVIGGGSVAMDCAESALKLGAKDVYLVYRRSYTQMPAEEDEKRAALNSGIHFLLLNQPVGFVADNSGKLTGLKMVRTSLGEPDASGRRSPKEIPGSEWVLKVDTVVEAIGSIPAEDSPTWYPNVKIDDKRLIKADPETGKTNVKGIFAGGDIVRGPALVVEAVQDGKTAARAIMEYLKQ